MIISCNECDASFMVDDSLIKETGSKVRCSNCSSVFVAYPQPPETDESQEFDLADLEEDDDSFESEGLLDELELDLDDFDDELGQDAEPEIEDLADDIGDELEVDLDLDDDDDIDPVMFDDAGDELPDLSDFEGLAGLDDDSLTVDDTDEDNGFELNTETDATAENDETDLELESDEELNLTDLDFEAEDEAEVEAALNSEELGFGLELDQDDDVQTDGPKTDMPTTMTRLDTIRKGMMRGLLARVPCSLRTATMLPAKVIIPITMERTRAMPCTHSMASVCFVIGSPLRTKKVASGSSCCCCCVGVRRSNNRVREHTVIVAISTAAVCCQAVIDSEPHYSSGTSNAPLPTNNNNTNLRRVRTPSGPPRARQSRCRRPPFPAIAPFPPRRPCPTLWRRRAPCWRQSARDPPRTCRWCRSSRRP